MSRPAAPDLAAWGRLARLADSLANVHLRDRPLDQSGLAGPRVRVDGLLFDFSRQRVTSEVLQELDKLAEERGWRRRVGELAEGTAVNTTERRPALHMALRAPAGQRPDAVQGAADALSRTDSLGSIANSPGPDVAPGVADTLARLRRFAAAVTTGSWVGCSGKALTDVVNIGIGGSDLGPRLVISALAPERGGLNFHFVHNVDGHVISSVLADLNPETTLFIVASKSFATQETRLNAETARCWFLERTNRPDALSRHFIAVTANRSEAAAFGLPPDNRFPIWDWVGGRYSLWSAVGLPIALALGVAGFDELLKGAHGMDRHFLTAPALANASLLAALLDIWNFNFLGATSHAVLPYDERLRLLPDHLQQLAMESNGKSVRHDGSRVGVHTMPVLWGGTGTNGQHAFHQLLHQGTRSFTADFIVAAAAGHGLADHHGWLVANALGQGKAMALGNEATDPHRAVPGNHATTTIVLDRLDPANLGALLAFYEHRVFCQGLIWDINSFDQWGVEFGKQLARTVFGQLAGESIAEQDPSTRSLIEHLIERERGGDNDSSAGTG